VTERVRSGLALRALVILAMTLALGATPGHVGGCNTESGLADPVMYCYQREAIECERDRVALRITDAEAATCNAAIPAMCDGFNFAPGCRPAASTTQACIDALSDPARIGTEDEAIAECQNLCGGASLVDDVEGI
jgi:hypothetical protein